MKKNIYRGLLNEKSRESPGPKMQDTMPGTSGALGEGKGRQQGPHFCPLAAVFPEDLPLLSFLDMALGRDGENRAPRAEKGVHQLSVSAWR